MGPHVLAFSISRQIEQIGSIAGYAAILGLAVLALLYFAQAREVKRLREWAGRAPERDAELQQRVTEEATRRASGQPATPAGTAAPAGAAPARPASPAAPATAPATAAAKPATPGQPKPAPSGSPAAGSPPARTAAGATPAAATPGAASPATAKPAPTPAPAAGGAGAAASKGPATPAPGTAGAPGTSGAAVPPVQKLPSPATAAAGAQPRPRRTVQVGGGPASAAPSTTVPAREPEERDRLINPRALLATVAAAVLVVVVLFASGVIGGGGDQGETTPSQSPTTAPSSTIAKTTPSGTVIPAPADTAVAVLNGTTVTGLARGAADRLTAKGYKVPRVTDAADQAQQKSLVAYTDGFQGSAKAIAKILGISSAQIVPMDASTQAVAGDSASVVVTMGADKAA